VVPGRQWRGGGGVGLRVALAGQQFSMARMYQYAPWRGEDPGIYYPATIRRQWQRALAAEVHLMTKACIINIHLRHVLTRTKCHGKVPGWGLF